MWKTSSIAAVLCCVLGAMQVQSAARPACPDKCPNSIHRQVNSCKYKCRGLGFGNMKNYTRCNPRDGYGSSGYCHNGFCISINGDPWRYPLPRGCLNKTSTIPPRTTKPQRHQCEDKCYEGEGLTTTCRYSCPAGGFGNYKDNTPCDPRNNYGSKGYCENGFCMSINGDPSWYPPPRECLKRTSTVPPSTTAAGQCEDKCYDGKGLTKTCMYPCLAGGFGNYKDYTPCDPDNKYGSKGYCQGGFCMSINGDPSWYPPPQGCQNTSSTLAPSTTKPKPDQCEDKCYEGQGLTSSCMYRCPDGGFGNYMDYTPCDPGNKFGSKGYCQGGFCMSINGDPGWYPPPRGCRNTTSPPRDPSGACEDRCHKGSKPVESCTFLCKSGKVGWYKRNTRCKPLTNNGSPGFCYERICVAVNGAPEDMPRAPIC